MTEDMYPLASEASDSDKSSSAQLEAGTRIQYFDILPENALDNIVRFFSRSPRAENWPNHTRLEDIYGFYDVEGELGSFLLGRFTGVHVIHGAGDNLNIHHKRLDTKGIIACTVDYILKISRSGRVITSFRTIIVSALAYGNDITAANFDNLSKKWPNIRCFISACVYISAVHWLRTFGENLESLYIGGSLANEISSHCTKLRHLDLKHCDWRGTYLKMFWERVGKNLETISTRFYDGNVAHCQHITKYCPRLKHFEITGMDVGIPKCIASYGEQVEFAKIDFETERDLKLVQSSCPNARFSIRVSKRSLSLALQLLGPQLDSVELIFVPYSSQTEEEHSVDWCSCTNIESVKFDGYPPVAYMERLFQKPKSLLNSIDIKLSPRNENWKDLIPLIAGGTGALEKLTLMCPEPPLGLFNKLVERNKCLSCVNVSFDCVLSDIRKIDVIETFLKGPALTKLVLDDGDSMLDIRDTPAVENLRRSLRHRRVCITAFGKVWSE